MVRCGTLSSTSPGSSNSMMLGWSSKNGVTTTTNTNPTALDHRPQQEFSKAFAPAWAHSSCDQSRGTHCARRTVIFDGASVGAPARAIQVLSHVHLDRDGGPNLTEKVGVEAVLGSPRFDTDHISADGLDTSLQAVYDWVSSHDKLEVLLHLARLSYAGLPCWRRILISLVAGGAGFVGSPPR